MMIMFCICDDSGFDDYPIAKLNLNDGNGLDLFVISALVVRKD